MAPKELSPTPPEFGFQRSPIQEMVVAFATHPIVRENRKARYTPPKPTTAPFQTLESRYLQEISGFRLIESVDKEKELARQLREGFEAWKMLQTPGVRPTPKQRKALEHLVASGVCGYNELFESNLKLVVKFAKNHPDLPNSSLLDRIQWGNAGLEHAVEKFDPEKDIKFSTYATLWIKQSISKNISSSSSTIRTPVNFDSQRREVARYEQDFVHTFGRPPSDKEIIQNIGVTQGTLAEIRRHSAMKLFSLDQDTGFDFDSSYHNVVADPASSKGYEGVEDSIESKQEVRVLKSLIEIGKLTLEERVIISLRTGILLPGLDPMTVIGADEKQQQYLFEALQRAHDARIDYTHGDLGELFKRKSERIRHIEKIGHLKIKRAVLLLKHADECNMDEGETGEFIEYITRATLKSGRQPKNKYQKLDHLQESIPSLLEACYGDGLGERVKSVIEPLVSDLTPEKASVIRKYFYQRYGVEPMTDLLIERELKILWPLMKIMEVDVQVLEALLP